MTTLPPLKVGMIATLGNGQRHIVDQVNTYIGAVFPVVLSDCSWRGLDGRKGNPADSPLDIIAAHDLDALLKENAELKARLNEDHLNEDNEK